MTSTIQEARMYQKRDTTEDWASATTFKPGPGELIIYEKDTNTVKPRMKIGDGETNLSDLPFLTGEVYAQANEPIDASEGAIWINEKEPLNALLSGGNEGRILTVNITIDSTGINSDVDYYDIATSLEIGYFIYAIISFVGSGGTTSQRYAVMSGYQVDEYIEFTTWGPGQGSSWLQEDNLSLSCKILPDNSVEVDFSGGGGADWSVNDEDSSGYVYNRPIWNQETDYTFETSEGEEIETGVFYITDFAPNYFKMDTIYIEVEVNETGLTGTSTWPIVGYFSTLTELNSKISELGSEADQKIYVLNGIEFNYLSDCYVFVDSHKNVLCEIISPNYKKTGNSKEEGIYIKKIESNNYNRQIVEFGFNYQEIIVNDSYSNYFKDERASNVFTLDFASIMNDSGLQQDKLVAMLLAELDRFEVGDIILLPASLIQGISEG